MGSHTDSDYVDISDLKRSTTFHFRVRAHFSGHPKDHGWSELCAAVACKTPATLVQGNATKTLQASLTSSKSFAIQVVREPWRDHPDYLTNHNGANYAGEASYLSKHARTGMQPLLEQFCVEILYPQFDAKTEKGLTTTGGSKHFANYASCGGNVDAKGNKNYTCYKINDRDCEWLGLSKAGCAGARTDASLMHSHKHVGLGFRNFSHGDPYALYSFPKEAECSAAQTVGDAGCTWKMLGNPHHPSQQDFRIVKAKAGMTAKEIKEEFDNIPMTQSLPCPSNPHFGFDSAEPSLIV